ncbi:MAG: nucleotidyltransferase domain-containing protein [Defluviitaleaceae bacterium]|nr:nucleotidyltransferase domain-containing protein [Defluviitaleaceae bacterium]
MNKFYEKTFKQHAQENPVLFWDILNTTTPSRTRIHPLKQAQIHKLLNDTPLKDFCERLVLFGSSVDASCRPDSDIDVAVWPKNGFRKKIDDLLVQETEGHVTIIWAEDLLSDEPIQQAIARGIDII